MKKVKKRSNNTQHESKTNDDNKASKAEKKV